MGLLGRDGLARGRMSLLWEDGSARGERLSMKANGCCILHLEPSRAVMT